MQYIDILISTEIKLDDTFPTMQFLVSGCFSYNAILSKWLFTTIQT